jgi:ADP-ribosyltransferase exoenzyme
MATTAAGATLTADQRVAQVSMRAATLRDVVRLWATVNPADLRGTIGTFADAASTVVRARNQESARSAAAYLAQFRAAEGVSGRISGATPARAPSAEDVAGSLRGAGLSGIIKSRRAGNTIEAASANGLVKVLGEASKIVIGGARDTVIAATDGDPLARGWQRVTSGSPCAFCSMLASRGPVYKNAKTSGFEPHGHCGCTAEPVYGAASATVVDLGKAFKDATAGKSGKDALNAWRRELNAKGTSRPVAAAGPASVKAAVKPALTFAERLAAAVSDAAALARAPFGLGRGADRHPDFTPELSRAINTYTGSEYQAINNLLRGKALPYGYEAADVESTIDAMRKAFTGSKLDSDVIVWRGMRTGKGVFGDSLGGDLTGFSWSEEGFGSASALERRAAGFAGQGGVMLRMFVPRGTGAIEASGVELEAELLLQDKLRVTVVADHGVNARGIRYLDVEVSA